MELGIRRRSTIKPPFAATSTDPLQWSCGIRRRSTPDLIKLLQVFGRLQWSCGIRRRSTIKHRHQQRLLSEASMELRHSPQINKLPFTPMGDEKTASMELRHSPQINITPSRSYSITYMLQWSCGIRRRSTREVLLHDGVNVHASMELRHSPQINLRYSYQ